VWTPEEMTRAVHVERTEMRNCYNISVGQLQVTKNKIWTEKKKEHNKENYTVMTFKFRTLHLIHQGDVTKEGGMGKMYSKYGENKKLLQNFGRKTLKGLNICET
jgi:hypothetical protein